MFVLTLLDYHKQVHHSLHSSITYTSTTTLPKLYKQCPH